MFGARQPAVKVSSREALQICYAWKGTDEKAFLKHSNSKLQREILAPSKRERERGTEEEERGTEEEGKAERGAEEEEKGRKGGTEEGGKPCGEGGKKIIKAGGEGRKEATDVFIYCLSDEDPDEPYQT